MNATTTATIAKTIAAFRTAHETGYIKLHCQLGVMGDKEIHFAATTAADESKGFGVDLSFSCEDFDSSIEELMKNVPEMFGFSSSSAKNEESAVPAAPVPRRQRAKKNVSSPEFVQVQPTLSQPVVSAPVTETVTVTEVAVEPMPAPRRRRPAAEVYSAELLNQLSISPEAFVSPSVPDTPTVPVMLDGQINLLDNLAPAPVETASAIASNPVAEKTESQSEPIAEPTVPVAPLIPETDEEKLEKALSYTIPSNLGHGGMTLGELIEKLDRQTAERELKWFAFSYRGKDIKLKRSAERVLSLFAA